MVGLLELAVIPVDDTDVVDSAYKKLKWAERRADELKGDIQSYRALDPIQFRQGRSTKSVFDPSLLVVRFYAAVDPQMPDWWGLALGDVLGSLRAALDHALVGHVRNQVPNLPESKERRLQFPVLTEPELWKGTSKNPGPERSLEGLCSPEVLDAVKNCQPFGFLPDRDPPQHPLSVLNRLVNADKHREVSVVAYVPHELTFDDSAPTVEIVGYAHGTSDLVDGAHAGTVIVRKPEPSVRWQAVSLKPVPTIGYVETTRIPGIVDEPGIGVGTVLDFLVEGVRTTLDEMAAAGA